MLWVQIEASESFPAIPTAVYSKDAVGEAIVFAHSTCVGREGGRKGPQRVCACVVYFRTRP